MFIISVLNRIKGFWSARYRTSIFGRLLVSVYLIAAGLILPFEIRPEYLGQPSEELFLQSLFVASLFIVPCILLWLKEPIAWLLLAILHFWIAYNLAIDLRQVLLDRDYIGPPNHKRDVIFVGVWTLIVLVYSVICMMRIYKRSRT